MKKLVWLAIIVAAVWYFFFRGPSPQTQQQTTTPAPTTTSAPTTIPTTLPNTPTGIPSTPTAPSAAQTGPNTVSVTSQAAGTTVTAMATLDAPGYVVIHKVENATPGAIIGASTLLPSGTNMKVTITLTQATKTGETYIAMLHKDNGDGNFAFPGDDTAIKDPQGNVVMMQFVISAPQPIAAPTKS